MNIVVVDSNGQYHKESILTPINLRVGQIAREVDTLARLYKAQEVRVDYRGVALGVVDHLKTRYERSYELVLIDGPRAKKDGGVFTKEDIDLLVKVAQGTPRTVTIPLSEDNIRAIQDAVVKGQA